MNLKERNIIIYKIAYEYLVSILPEGVCESDLDGYNWFYRICKNKIKWMILVYIMNIFTNNWIKP